MLNRLPTRHGLGRTDVIVLLIVLLLSGNIVLPLMVNLRERMRLKQCQANLRQLGQALLSYHESFQSLPPAATWGAEGVDLAQLGAFEDPTPIHLTEQNWIQLLLPDLGQAELFHRFDFGVPVAHEKNREGRQTRIVSLSCPSDPYNSDGNLYEMPLPTGEVARFTRGNYAINGGADFRPAGHDTLANPGPKGPFFEMNETARSFSFLGSGIAGINKSYSLKDFNNGSATLVAIEEVRAGLHPIDTRGVWALGQIGASITWGHGMLGDAGAPNANEPSKHADDIRFGREFYKLVGRKKINEERMQACDHCDENSQATSRSKHAGGVNVMTLDGAAHFVSDKVEPSVWHIMHSRNTPANILAASFELELNGYSAEAKPVSEIERDRRRGDPSTSVPERLVNSLGMEFVRIPAGEFTMGLGDSNCSSPFPSDAVPHRVRLRRDYLIGVFEVTQEQYEKVVGKNPSWYSANGDGAIKIGDADTRDWPVENLTWDEAAQFCLKLSDLAEEKVSRRTYRLPTEAEWERACRHGVTTEIPKRPWDEAFQMGEIGGNNPPPEIDLVPRPIGTYPPNAYGVHDMCGNVFEWTADYVRKGRYVSSGVDDPQGPLTGYLRVIRGWHWIATGPLCRVYVSNEPWTGSRFIGFRAICEIHHESD